ncbi:M14 family metallopeptidase [Membranihabitans marinus]
MRHLSQQSDRIHYIEHGKTHESRPLIALIISHPKNIENLENIRQQHISLTDLGSSSNGSHKDLPLVVWQGYSIHGNEASGANAAMLHAYNLAASQSKEIMEILEETVIILYPSFNPDGLQRFSSWVNSQKNFTLTSDPQDREYRETWPGGRTNHYWFDLNRDWLPVQQPESMAKIELYQQWRPNILTDHHEMGTSSTFFFQPGIPSRTNPHTPEINQQLTAQIAEFHGHALDSIGSLYYAKESFDDFYYGKGSTYPDIQGCIGILFEQASSRGHLQESDHGLLSFPFTIRNQFITSMSTLRAGLALKDELQSYQIDYFKNQKPSKNSGYVFGDNNSYKNKALVNILLAHDIQVYRLKNDIRTSRHDFSKEESYYVPMYQRQSTLIETIFEKNTTFKDSLFYDVSTWTLPLAFDIPFSLTDKVQMGEKVLEVSTSPKSEFRKSDYGYLISWSDYLSPKVLYQLQSNGIRVKVAKSPFTYKGSSFGYGSLMVILQNQDKEKIESILAHAHETDEVKVFPVSTGTMSDSYLGSPNFAATTQPKIGLIVGDGVKAGSVGEIWHLLDTRYQIPITKLNIARFNQYDLSKYNTIILADGSGQGISKDKLLSWLRNGGNLITIGSAGQWLRRQGIGDWKYKSPENPTNINVAYDQINSYHGARYTGGCIVETKVDLSHPLLYGYNRNTLAVFKNNNLVFEPSNYQYKNPILYSPQPLLSGYLHKVNKNMMAGGSAIHVATIGGGRLVNFADNPNFRAFWYGTNKLFTNAIFFGDLIQSRATN